ncbi:MAG: hypothetical protein EPN73_21855 [Paraburkholderia sp.]|uniref:hypothetical protein n=1 Tax=Paraburkholderia sp. TaxID=1926495 RepID=UPI0012173AC1|nr:hypothetical protein [Paraburkholderia sp.]TAL93390.1 MAG: hypothetical protein EPN73_21855 [Paraburkholderia sp.]
MLLIIKLALASFLLIGLTYFLCVLPFRLMRHVKALGARDAQNPTWIALIDFAGTLVLLWGIGQGLFEWKMTGTFDPRHRLLIVLAGVVLVAVASRLKARRRVR